MFEHLAARAHLALLAAPGRLRRPGGEERAQGTVEYVGLAMAVGVLLLAVGSFLSGKDHGIGSAVTGAIKSALEQATGGGKS